MKLCVNCRHYKQGLCLYYAYEDMSRVTGDITIRGQLSAKDMRYDIAFITIEDKNCGEEARYWEPSED